jgi:hypothetical protein
MKHQKVKQPGQPEPVKAERSEPIGLGLDRLRLAWRKQTRPLVARKMSIGLGAG